MDAETKERIERLRAIEPSDYVGSAVVEVVWAFMGGNVSAMELRDTIIALLEQADPDGWTDEQLSEYGLVRLPKDRDGEVIRIGDTVWDDSDDPYEWTVIGIGIGDVAPHFPIRCANEQFETGFKTEQITHRPPVTVKSVLREFLSDSEDAMRKGYDEVPHEVFAEYAKRLRLAKEDE